LVHSVHDVDAVCDFVVAGLLFLSTDLPSPTVASVTAFRLSIANTDDRFGERLVAKRAVGANENVCRDPIRPAVGFSAG